MTFQRQGSPASRLVVVSALFVASVCFGLSLSADKLRQPGEPSSRTARATGRTAADALTRLREGNARFVVDDLATRATYPDQRRQLAKGQEPLAVVLACADSRVVPELIFNQELGELFVIRVAGNVTDPVVIGSIEYAVEHLHCPLVVVLGHQQRGAVKAAVAGEDGEGNLGELVKRVYVGPDRATLLQEVKGVEEAVEVGVRLNVRHHLHELTVKSDVLKKLAAEDGVRIEGAVYSLETGRVEWLKAAAAMRPGKDKPRR